MQTLLNSFSNNLDQRYGTGTLSHDDKLAIQKWLLEKGYDIESLDFNDTRLFSDFEEYIHYIYFTNDQDSSEALVHRLMSAVHGGNPNNPNINPVVNAHDILIENPKSTLQLPNGKYFIIFEN